MNFKMIATTINKLRFNLRFPSTHPLILTDITSYILKDTSMIDRIRTFLDRLSHLQLLLMKNQGLLWIFQLNENSENKGQKWVNVSLALQNFYKQYHARRSIAALKCTLAVFLTSQDITSI